MPQMRVATPIGLGQLARPARDVDMMQALGQGYQTGEYMANRGVRDETAQQALGFGRQKQQLGQQQQQLNEQALETGGIANQSAREKQRISSIAIGAAEIQGLPPSQQLKALQNRAARLQAEGIDNSDTLEGIQLLQSDPQAFQETIGQAVEYGRMTGILSPANTKGAELALKQRKLDIDEEGLGLRRLESEQRALDRELNRETNEIKREKLGLEIEDKKQQIETAKRDKQETSHQRIVAQEAIIDSGNDTLKLMRDIVEHPGFDDYVGSTFTPSMGFGLFDEPVRGSDAAGVKSLIDTLDAQSFLTAIQKFKDAGGAGSLSDAEGLKLSKAISSLDNAQSEADFKASINTIQTIISRQISLANSNLRREQKRSDDELVNEYLEKVGQSE